MSRKSASNRPVAVTGIGIITSLGRGRQENWRKLVAGSSGIHRLTRFPIEGLRTTIGGSVDFLDLDPISVPALSLALAREVCAEAIAQSGVGEAKSFPGELFLASPPLEQGWPQRMILAQRMPGIRETGPRYADLLQAAAQDCGDMHTDFLNGTIADSLAEEFGTQGSPITLSTACASGATAIQLGVEAIRRGSKAALSVGTDGSLQAEALIRFTLLSALSTANEIPEQAAKPFSKNRDGFVMAEGAAALVLEDADHAKTRGAKILAYVRGCGEAADTFHRTRSNPNGAAIVGCMQRALADAGIGPEDVDYINAHGTGTPENDKMESFGIQQVFGARASSVPVSSNKSMIGHTLTAAGAVEAAFSVLTLNEGLLPPTINYAQPDPAIPLDVVPNEARRADVAFILSNSFGFGGQNVSLVLSREAT
ncbi:beta-ketoacyl-ACP synthase [Rhodospirillaceae bacterium SYSU D60014]|uniref:beta-ketoacyl-ACP synthase n=1 Tax=Virgifigura deserti TaxID=2268457 RepID=UPI000E65F936